MPIATLMSHLVIMVTKRNDLFRIRMMYGYLRSEKSAGMDAATRDALESVLFESSFGADLRSAAELHAVRETIESVRKRRRLRPLAKSSSSRPRKIRAAK